MKNDPLGTRVFASAESLADSPVTPSLRSGSRCSGCGQRNRAWEVSQDAVEWLRKPWLQVRLGANDAPRSDVANVALCEFVVDVVVEHYYPSASTMATGKPEYPAESSSRKG